MSYTTLGFYRKVQTLECLEDERPKSLETLRKILRRAVQDIEARIVNIEEIYYEGSTCEENMEKCIPALRECMERFSMTSIHAIWQIDDLIHRFTKHGAHYPEHHDAVATLRQFTMKAKTFIPVQFDSLMGDIMLILKHAQRYFLSFFKNDKKDTYLDTAYEYESVGMEFTAAIKMHLNDISKMAKSFKAGGLCSKMFGMDTNEIARKCECPDLPILLVFPEACSNIRLALKSLNKWIDSDENYTRFIHNDIVELTAKKRTQEKIVKDRQQTYVLVEHHIKAAKKEINHLDDELKKLHGREVQMEGDINQLKEDIAEVQKEIDLREEEKSELRQMIEQHLKREKANRNRGSMDVGFLTDKIEAISGEITRMGLTISVINRQIEGHRNKMRVILDKRELRDQKAKFVKRQSNKKVKAGSELSQASKELERITACLDCLKYIYRLRKSSDITAKIFRNLPFQARNSRMLPKRCSTSLEFNRKDELDKAIEIVAHLVGADWPKVYRALPYFPYRGETLLDTDVDDIIKSGYRSAVEFQGLECLRRWRRMNAHSSLPELKKTLEHLGRSDVLIKLEYFMKHSWPKSRVENEDEKYPYDTKALKRFFSISPLRSHTSLDGSLIA